MSDEGPQRESVTLPRSAESGSTTIVVVPASPRSQPALREARDVAERLGLPFARSEREVDDTTLVLRCTRDGLELAHPAFGRAGVRPDYRSLDLRPNGRSLSKRQPLAKAIGREATTVFDATAGLARDSVLIAALGYTVTACERVPVIAALARDALARSDCPVDPAIRDRLTIHTGDARLLLAEATPDVIFLDPMFPPKRKTSALPKKRNRILRAAVGDDDDAAELLDVARTRARRVVVKRTDDAERLAPDPTVSFTGRSTRYDVYVSVG